jgi:perosamine synthetase
MEENSPRLRSPEIPMSSPDISDLEIGAVTEILKTSHLSIGPRIVEFEKRCAAYIGAQRGIAVSSGTAGLHLSVMAADVGPGDLVITTPFSFVASANIVLYERAIPVFVDIDPLTLNIDPQRVAEAVHELARGGQTGARWLPPALQGGERSTAGNRVKAILPVHVFGQPADMDPLLEAARRYDLAAIEDACEAIGAEYKGRKVGALGDAGVFAFYPNKQMTTGEGGMIMTDRDDWDVLFRSLRNQGRDVFDGWLNHSRLGYNYRLDEMSAALGLAQLGRIEELLARREQVANWYNERLASVELVKTPHVAETTTRMSWFVYVVRLAPEVDRDWAIAQLEQCGIPSRVYFTPIHLQPFYVREFGYSAGDFPITESASKSCLALPFSGVMTESQVDYVCENLIKVIN